jgi:glycosyltransferase involved in cell wall biosynthesis
MGIPRERVVMIANPLPATATAAVNRSALRRQLGIADAAVLLLGVGRLSAEKNFRMIIDMVRILSARVGEVLAVIVGEGPMRDELQWYADAQGVGSQVRLVGYRTDVEAFYGCADFFVQPSLAELQSLAMLEAMRHRLPVLVTERTGCNDELIVHGQNGFLLDPTRPETWAHSIERLLPDPRLCRLLGANAAKTVAEVCDARVVSRVLEALYVELAGTSSGVTSEAGCSLGQT